MEGQTETVIDAQADIQGKLTGKDVRVLGRYRGEIELAGRLVLGEGSRVEAKVKADALEIAGEFKGDIVARSVTLLEKARVEGTLDAQTLSVREGAVINGRVSAGPAPAPAARPAASVASATPAKPAPGAVAG